MPKITPQAGSKSQPKTNLPQWEDITGLDPWIKMALYGRSGSGKTTLWATFPPPIGAMIASGAGETKSISNVPGIQAVRFTNMEQFPALVEQQAKTKQFKTFVLDHASGFQDLVLAHILGRDVPQQLSWGFAGREEWSKVASIMKEYLIQMLRLECHVVIVAQERTFNIDEDSSGNGVLAPYVNCALSPSVTGWLGPQVDYLVETFKREEVKKETTTIKLSGNKTKEIEQEVKTGNIQFCLRTAPHPVYDTKFRVPKGTPLPSVIVDPSFTKIQNLIVGKPAGDK